MEEGGVYLMGLGESKVLPTRKPTLERQLLFYIYIYTEINWNRFDFDTHGIHF